MKRKLFLSVAALMSTAILFSCGNSSNGNNTSSANGQETSISSIGSEASSAFGDGYDCITIAQAIELAGTDSTYTTPDSYYVLGTVKEVTNSTYGNMTITDGTNELSIYGCYNRDGTIRYDAMEEKPVAGDQVVFYGQLTYYKMAEMKDAKLMEMHHDIPVASDDYVEMDIASARSKAAGTNVKLSGIVARITFANGNKPNGFILVDNTSSIYCYDSQAAQQVTIGNRITIQGSKTYFVAETEATYAAEFGYNGSAQIESVTLLDNDKGTNDVDYSWAQEKTIKDIVETSVSEDITSLVYKTYGIVTKKENPGFTNYYLNDIDGKTGSYVYTACNGADFSWLDAYDGKLVTMYVTALNAKSTNSGCVYRLLPVSIGEEYTVSESYYPEYAAKYVAFGDVKEKYEADPALELVNSVDNELIGASDIKVTYSSSNEKVISFTTTEEKTVMHAGENGTATITAKATYKTYEYSYTKTVKVQQAKEYESVTVAEAIAAEDDTLVTVKGIVGPSCTNQTAFYLIDDSGIVAVRTTSEQIADIKQGNLIIIQGMKKHFKSSTSTNGQVVLDDSDILSNFQGNTPYSTNSFQTIDDLDTLNNLSVLEEHTATGYKIRGKIEFVETNYYTSVKFLSPDGTKSMSIYCSSASQLSWANDYAGQELEYDVAICNWNGKTTNRLAILALTTADGVRVTNTSSVK